MTYKSYNGMSSNDIQNHGIMESWPILDALQRKDMRSAQ